MLRRQEDMRREVRSNLRGGNGDLRFTHLLEPGDLHAKLRLAAGIVIGLALGASLTLAIQGRASLPDPSVPAPSDEAPRTEPQPPEAYLVWTSGGMPDGFGRDVRHLDGLAGLGAGDPGVLQHPARRQRDGRREGAHHEHGARRRCGDGHGDHARVDAVHRVQPRELGVPDPLGDAVEAGDEATDQVPDGTPSARRDSRCLLGRAGSGKRAG